MCRLLVLIGFVVSFGVLSWAGSGDKFPANGIVPGDSFDELSKVPPGALVVFDLLGVVFGLNYDLIDPRFPKLLKMLHAHGVFTMGLSKISPSKTEFILNALEQKDVFFKAPFGLDDDVTIALPNRSTTLPNRSARAAAMSGGIQARFVNSVFLISEGNSKGDVDKLFAEYGYKARFLVVVDDDEGNLTEIQALARRLEAASEEFKFHLILFNTKGAYRIVALRELAESAQAESVGGELSQAAPVKACGRVHSEKR
ncbi:MAG: hypothetical protein C5B49_07530 [Bdellovibrio sp.]|nr:MAG: hypothetical protein C5B49_07530 [Bdellovibrio sp.]